MTDTPDTWDGDGLLRALAALASSHRLRIVATLTRGPLHVSALARAVELSRPLAHMHLQRLEAAGLVRSSLELSADGKALRVFEVVPFALPLTPGLVADAAETITRDKEQQT